ncbi:MAG TPA: DMT family transporter, partial [Bdellovibrionota bacterium]|nr:DMT family transporter [Bdellovibrionota bacterium]
MNPTLLLACGSLVLSSAPLLVRASSVGPTATGAYRCLLAVPMIALWLLARRQSLLPVGAGRRYWTSVIGAGTVFACDLGLWHRAIHFAGPGLATVLANTQVFFTGAFGVLFFGERAGRRFWLSTLGAFGGMAALVWRVGAAPTVAEGSRYWAGVGMGIVAAFCYSLFIILLRRSAVPAGF